MQDWDQHHELYPHKLRVDAIGITTWTASVSKAVNGVNFAMNSNVKKIQLHCARNMCSTLVKYVTLFPPRLVFCL